MSELLHILGLPLLICVLAGSMLAHLGIHVLKREVIFIDIAVAQIAAVGSLAAHLAFDAEEDAFISYAFSLALVLLISAFYAVVRKRVTQISIEAVIGISYAITAAGGLFLIGVAPGHAHAHEMLAGNLLWVTWRNIFTCLAVFSGVGLCLFVVRKPLSQISNNYHQAVERGINVAWWDFVFYALAGVAIALSVRIIGVVVVFAFLIIPATISALFSARWLMRMFIACATTMMASIAGLLFSYYLDDFSMGPPIALFLGAFLLIAAVLAKLRPRAIKAPG